MKRQYINEPCVLPSVTNTKRFNTLISDRAIGVHDRT